MKTSAPRGSIIHKYDKNNKVLYIQWKDNKVMSLLSTTGKSGLVNVHCQVGGKFVHVKTDITVKENVEFMGGVDCVDQRIKCVGGFAC